MDRLKNQEKGGIENGENIFFETVWVCVCNYLQMCVYASNKCCICGCW